MLSDLLKEYDGIIGAFIGAFSAGIIASATLWYERKNKKEIEKQENKKETALILRKIELRVSQLMNLNSDNEQSLKNLQEAINRTSIGNTHFHKISFDIDLLLKIKNVDLLNDLFDLGIDILKLNGDIERLEKDYHAIQNLLIAEKITPDHTKKLLKNIDKIQRFQRSISEDLKKAVTKIRITAKSPDRYDYPSKMTELVDKELLQLDSEIEYKSKLDEEKITGIMGSPID